ncbi:MAG: hypothetical protein AAF492_14910, partial [Verrucomicrobiota bacterium]
PGYTLGEPTVMGQTLTWTSLFDTALSETGRVRGLSGDILFSYQVQVTAPPGQFLTNRISVTTTSTEDPVFTNEAERIVHTPYADPVVNKSGPAVGEPGEDEVWTIDYRNLSPEVASNVFLVDSLPDFDGNGMVDITFVGATAAGPGPVSVWYHANPSTPVPVFDPLAPTANGWTNSSAGIVVAHVAWLVGTLPGSAGPYTLQLTAGLLHPVTGADAPAGAKLTNQVEIFLSNTDANPANNTDAFLTRVPGLDMSLTKTGSEEGGFPGTAPGKGLIYTLEFENSGTVNAYGLRVVDTLPANVSLGSPLDDFETVNLFDPLGSGLDMVDTVGTPITFPVEVTRVITSTNITWYLGSIADTNAPDYYRKLGMPPGAVGRFQMTVEIDETVPDGGSVMNTAQVISDRQEDSDPAEEFLANNVDDTEVTVYRPDLIVTKSVRDIVDDSEAFTESGNELEYTISYGNLGNFAAEDTVIAEVIPEGTIYVPGSLTVPQGATAAFTPSLADVERFDVSFLEPLPAPATFASDTLTLKPPSEVKASYKLSGTRGGVPELPLDGFDQFGLGTAGLGDLNDDGVVDIAVGAPADDDGAINAGAVYIFFMNADGTYMATQKISQLTTPSLGLNA